MAGQAHWARRWALGNSLHDTSEKKTDIFWSLFVSTLELLCPKTGKSFQERVDRVFIKNHKSKWKCLLLSYCQDPKTVHDHENTWLWPKKWPKRQKYPLKIDKNWPNHQKWKKSYCNKNTKNETNWPKKMHKNDQITKKLCNENGWKREKIDQKITKIFCLTSNQAKGSKVVLN